MNSWKQLPPKFLHIELSTFCNAACPMCARNINGGEDNPQLPEVELTAADVETMFPIEFVKQLERMYMCGNYGDPIAAKDTLEIFQYFRLHNPKMTLSLHTNGSAKSIEWWAHLATILGPKGYVVFSVDGLEDTNHLYRQNTVFSKIMTNAQAFINAGGRARWDYIVFAHNEHQVEEAETLAKTMGFEKFQFKKSARFFSNASGVTKEMHQSANRKGIQTTLLQPPTNPKYRNSALQELSKIASTTNEIKFLPSKVVDLDSILGKQVFHIEEDKKSPMEKYWDTADIKCKVAEEKSIYVSAEGIVQPCCWTAGQMYVWYWHPESSQIWDLINAVGKDNLNAKNTSLQGIVDGLFFQTLLPDSWKKTSCADGKLAVCAKTCGGKYDAFTEQFK
jgi:MoaA/NifB/PqqE/SkfB family radical SAM enzyme